jgi:c-di-GMP-binding flagellar brake protein YcgR
MKESEKSLLGDKNRRRFFRHACDASIKSAFEYDRKEKWDVRIRRGYLKSDVIGQSHVRVLNISEGGIALVSRFPVAKGAVASLKIETAFDTTIHAQARVSWARRMKTMREAYAVGLEFVEMSRENVRNLNNLLKTLQKASPKEKHPSGRN